MPDAKEKPAETTEEPEEDAELSELRSKVSFDETSYRNLLKEQGVPDAIVDLLVKPIKEQSDINARVLARQSARDLTDYRSKLSSEFPLADPDLISGTTKREMRASAQNLQKFGERVLAAAGKAPAAPGATTTTTTAPGTTPVGERAAAWGQPPASATETINEAPAVPWDQLRGKAANVLKPEAKREIIAEIKKNGAMGSPRQAFSSIVARNAPKPEGQQQA